MRLMFVYWAYEDQGSGLVLQGYAEAARELGHEVAVYGRPYARIPLHFSRDLDAADAVVFLFEWTTRLWCGDCLDLLRLLGRVPRRRRVIVDGDGNYNDVIRLEGDYNHATAESARAWAEVCDSLADKICQPTLRPLRPNVRPFLFYAYNPAWERPLRGGRKEFDLLYVGHSKFRWPPLRRVLRAVEPVRGRVGRIGLVGHGWDAPPKWAAPLQLHDAYYSDPVYLLKLGVEVLEAVPFEQVIDRMSTATLNPVLSRRLFRHLRMVTPRFFETLAADTIPLFVLDEAHVAEVYGEQALELVLKDDRADEQVLDLLRRPDHYREVVCGIRRHLAEKHSHAARLRQLIEIVES
jgi:glycosyl transferase family 1